jgi:hypothetical protein
VQVVVWVEIGRDVPLQQHLVMNPKKNNTSLVLFLLVGYFTVLSVTWTVQHQILQQFMNKELKRIW